jgi:cell division protease FtsH
LGEASQRASTVLKANRAVLDSLAAELLEHETLDEKQVAEILKGAKLPATAKLY